MTLEQFAKALDLTSLSEVDRVCFLAYFYLKTKSTKEFTVAEAAKWLTAMHFASPNQSRLHNKLKESDKTVKGERGFKLAVKFVEEMEKRFPQLSETSQDVVDGGAILPEVDYKATRGYIETIAKQINASYEHNLFDGCAVLMRRLVEVLLILSYRNLGIESEIQDASQNYQMLEAIISNAKNNTALKLSRNSKGSLDTFRELGNFSAHKIEYTCRREYIREHIQSYRALIVELLHKSGLRV
jgi:hypothetical protein